jgi:adenylate cyclase class IV
MDTSERRVKENIEIRFFMTSANARKLLATWKSEKRQLEPYSFVDHYFVRGRLRTKVRVWRSAHTPKTEVISFRRRNGVKTEETMSATNLRAATRELESLGFIPYLKIVKKKAWLVSGDGKSTYALELVSRLGWTGEIEVPVRHRKRIPRYLKQLQLMGAVSHSKKSMLQLMEEKLKGKEIRGISRVSSEKPRLN